MARNESNISTQKLKNDLKQISKKAGEKVKRTLSKTISDVLGDEKKTKSPSRKSARKSKSSPLRTAVLKAEKGVRRGKSPATVAREFVQDGVGYSKKHSRSTKKARSKKAAARRPSSSKRSRIPVSRKAPRAEQSSRV